MGEWKVYFYLAGARRDNAIRAWLKDEAISVAQMASFQEKIDTLEQGGPEMVPGFISETPVAPHIYKMKIKGNKGMKQLRPMCCRGPFYSNEYTILVGAIEKDKKLVPADVKKRAQDYRKALIADPSRRVRERIAPKPNK
jgi:hypothetical protein